MKFIETPLPGCHLVELDRIGDARGYFARTFCAREFEAAGLNGEIVQTSISYNARKGTLRGLHFQSHPAMEDKLVRCIRGAIFDVVVDIRPGSPTFGKWIGYELTEDNDRQLFAPKGFAHGFQTLTEDSIVAYGIAQFYDAQRSAGIRWNDPAIAVEWPLPPAEQSPRDLSLPLLADIDRDLLMPFDGSGQ